MSNLAEIQLNEVEKIRSWFRNNYGVVSWKSVDMSAPRPNLTAPLVPTVVISGEETRWTVDQIIQTPELAKPHWAYVLDRKLTEADIRVSIVEPITWPQALFDPCEKCGRTGRRDLSELAAVNHVSMTELKARINPAGHECPPYQACNVCVKITDYREADETFQCTYCHGTGCADHGHIYVRMKYTWFGPKCMAEQKVHRLQQKIGAIYGEDPARGCVWMDYDMVDSDCAILRPVWYWTIPLADLDSQATLDRASGRLEQLRSITGVAELVTSEMRKQRLREREKNKPPRPPLWPREEAERRALEKFLQRKEGE